MQHQRLSSGERCTVGILGCMAERLKDRLLESSLVQIVAGVESIPHGIAATVFVCQVFLWASG